MLDMILKQDFISHSRISLVTTLTISHEIIFENGIFKNLRKFRKIQMHSEKLTNLFNTKIKYFICLFIK